MYKGEEILLQLYRILLRSSLKYCAMFLSSYCYGRNATEIHQAGPCGIDLTHEERLSRQGLHSFRTLGRMDAGKIISLAGKSTTGD